MVVTQQRAAKGQKESAPAYGQFIGGKWVNSTSSARIESRAPATGRLIATFPDGTKEDTVIRYVRKAGRHARLLHGELLAVSPSDP